MQTLQYVGYFFYLAWNWNAGIAWHIIKNEIRGEKKYKINSTGADELKKLEAKGIDIDHSTIYMPASYDLLEKIFKQVNISSFKHFIDLGCGKGRAMCVAAYHGAGNMTGVDFSKELCAAANKNLAMTKTIFPGLNYKLINNDAYYYQLPEDSDCIFLFNPFDDFIMSGVLRNINDSLKLHPRKMTILYFNPMQKHLFLEDGYKEIFHTKQYRYLEALVLTK